MPSADPHHPSLPARLGSVLAGQPWLVLVTLLLAGGIALAFWQARARIERQARAGDETFLRGSAARLPCAQATLVPDPAAPVAAFAALLLQQRAFVSNGPDEFGEWQLRFRSAERREAIAALRRSPLVLRVTDLPACR